MRPKDLRVTWDIQDPATGETKSPVIILAAADLPRRNPERDEVIAAHVRRQTPKGWETTAGHTVTEL